VAGLALLSIPLWLGSMLYLFIKDQETEGVQKREEPRGQAQRKQTPSEGKRRK
jgi:hypothetical protein